MQAFPLSLTFLSQSRSIPLPTSGPAAANLSNTVPGMGMYDKYAQQYEQFQKQSYFHLASPVRDKDVKPMQAAQTSAGRYGIVALYNDIRLANPAGTSHALGLDLTVLGLALTSPEPLHKHFASPWADEPAKGDPEFTVPECYYDKLPPSLKVSLSS